ncbi:RasGEF domain-containing protein [Thermoproteota archaeon]
MNPTDLEVYVKGFHNLSKLTDLNENEQKLFEDMSERLYEKTNTVFKEIEQKSYNELKDHFRRTTLLKNTRLPNGPKYNKLNIDIGRTVIEMECAILENESDSINIQSAKEVDSIIGHVKEQGVYTLKHEDVPISKMQTRIKRFNTYKKNHLTQPMRKGETIGTDEIMQLLIDGKGTFTKHELAFMLVNVIQNQSPPAMDAKKILAEELLRTTFPKFRSNIAVWDSKTLTNTYEELKGKPYRESVEGVMAGTLRFAVRIRLSETIQFDFTTNKILLPKSKLTEMKTMMENTQQTESGLYKDINACLNDPRVNEMDAIRNMDENGIMAAFQTGRTSIKGLDTMLARLKTLKSQNADLYDKIAETLYRNILTAVQEKTGSIYDIALGLKQLEKPGISRENEEPKKPVENMDYPRLLASLNNFHPTPEEEQSASLTEKRALSDIRTRFQYIIDKANQEEAPQPTEAQKRHNLPKLSTVFSKMTQHATPKQMALVFRAQNAEVFSRIKESELRHMGAPNKFQPDYGPHIREWQNRINVLSDMFTNIIIAGKTPEECVSFYQYLIQLADESVNRGDYLTGFSITAALSNHDIARLRLPLETIPPNILEVLSHLNSLTQTASMSGYRKDIQAKTGMPVIPHIAEISGRFTYAKDGNIRQVGESMVQEIEMEFIEQQTRWEDFDPTTEVNYPEPRLAQAIKSLLPAWTSG